MIRIFQNRCQICLKSGVEGISGLYVNKTFGSLISLSPIHFLHPYNFCLFYVKRIWKHMAECHS
jgi:hypothetical protein